MKVIFFNFWHNGDLHVSRGIIRKIIEKVKQQDPTTTFIYSHKCHPTLLQDIPDLEYDPEPIKLLRNEHDNLIRVKDSVYINTWYGQQHQKYVRMYETTFDCLYTALDDTCKQLWNFSLSDISTDLRDFFPRIDYSKYYIEEAEQWLSNHGEQKILIENGFALSNQSNNFALEPIIIEMARKYPQKTFILTSPAVILEKPDNIVFSSEIIKKNIKSDLNEVSYLSSHCDVIVGRASGVFSFSLTQENLFKRNVRYLCFCYPRFISSPNKFWLSNKFQDKINYASSILATNDCGRAQILIEERLSNVIQYNT